MARQESDNLPEERRGVVHHLRNHVSRSQKWCVDLGSPQHHLITYEHKYECDHGRGICLASAWETSEVGELIAVVSRGSDVEQYLCQSGRVINHRSAERFKQLRSIHRKGNPRVNA